MQIARKTAAALLPKAESPAKAVCVESPPERAVKTAANNRHTKKPAAKILLSKVLLLNILSPIQF